ncbi:hypothetical protein QYE76_052878 [Lolium multiflorum]|uniref:CCHC-type domain-containing protein n=1 Tax=Lolium multiflorum TaxID=4521 RepID=A0AAD8WJJ5_LOLMU|nr:hypothetical protein QYE76_052878 [Lolium multiflorum]
MRIVLTAGQLLYVVDAPLGDPPAETATDEAKNVYLTRKNHYSTVQCAILYGLESELQKRFENHDPHDIISELKMIFETHAVVESYDASEKFFNCKMEEGNSVSEHVLKMSGHAKQLLDLGITIHNALGIHRVLQSLPPSYKNFVMNYNMQCMEKMLPELFSMLKTAEVEIKKEHQVLMVNKTTNFKKQGKPKEKGKFKKGGKKGAAPPKKPEAGPKPDTVCYYCKEEAHWKRNCSKYPADLKSGNIKKKDLPVRAPPKNEGDPHPGATSSNKKEEPVKKEEAPSSARHPPTKRSRMWADSEDDDDDEEGEEEEEDDSSSSAGYPPTKRFRSWADSEDDDDDEEEEASAEDLGSSDEEASGSSAWLRR